MGEGQQAGGSSGDPFAAARKRALALGARPMPPSRQALPAREALPAPLAHGQPDDPLEHRFGLVLAGGAAKGAYQVGAIECLARAGVRITAIAGTSIGALNGVVLAGAPTPEEGAARLVDLWSAFSEAFGDAPFGEKGPAHESLVQRFGNLAPRVARLLGSKGDLERLADQAIDAEALRTGTTMRVAAYPILPPADLRHLRHLKLVQTATDWIGGVLGVRSHIITLNGLNHAEIKEAVLASAALPFLFRPRQVAGRYYRDGMLGRDNTPIRALADLDHCDIVIVVHLSPGEPVKHVEHEGLTLLQVRPRDGLVPGGALGSVSGLLDFSPGTCQRLRGRGYDDMERLLTDTTRLVMSARRLREAERFMSGQVQRVLDNRARRGPAPERRES
ncbi:patatin-like phospholipase family protein [Microbispora sp. H10836]|uniref:patatin-like phospholipase family protein n=1 Tax=Microbispora sp. H10836 TaxID=2729106 RepID=UPI00147538D2|nr:patatin-like phospholipase family protein [Microbispora sp. H10836]